MKADFGADDGRIARFGLIDRGVVGPKRAIVSAVPMFGIPLRRRAT
jgi:hypothetical protein